MEHEIINHNRNHFRKVFETIAYKDRICTKLEDDEIRHKILSGDLDIEDCSYDDAHKFLTLLAKPTHQEGNYYNEMTCEE